MTTAAQNTALAQPLVRVAYFVQFEFLSGTSRISTANFSITWGGFEWSGVGSIATIGTVEESDGLDAKSLSFSINSAQPSWLSLAIGDVGEYRGRPAKMYMCPLNEAFQLIDTPVICWSGIMDVMSVGIEGESGSITLKCETSAHGLKRRPSFRLNAAQHKKLNATDTGLDYLTDLLANPQVWLSQKFQKR